MIQRALGLLLFLTLTLASTTRAQEADVDAVAREASADAIVRLRAELDAPDVPFLKAPALGATLTEGPRLEVDPATGLASLFDVDLVARDDGSLELRRVHGAARTASGHFGRGCRTDLDARVRTYGRFAVVDRPEGVTLFVADQADRWLSLAGPEVEVLVREDGRYLLCSWTRTWRFDGDGQLTELDPGYRVERAPGRVRLRAQDHDEELTLDLDGAGRITRARRAGGEVRYGYDLDGRLVSVAGASTRTLRHDAQGRVTGLETPEGKLALSHDRAGRLASLVRGAWTQTYRATPAPDAEGYALAQLAVETPEGSWSYTREVDGWTIDGPDGSSRLWQDGRGRVVSIRHPDGRVESIAWDERGNPTPAGREASTLPGGAPVQESDDGKTSTLETSVEAGGARETIERDAAGRVVARTTPDGRTTRFEHDARGFVTARVAPAGRTVYERDAVGRAVRVTSPAGRTFTYRFDGNRLVARDGPAGARATDVSASGRRTLLAGPGDRRLVIEADPATGRVDLEDDQGVTTWLVSDDLGRLVEAGDAGGVRRLTWGADGLPSALEANGATIRWTRSPTGARVETPWGAFERTFFATSERVTSPAGRFEAEVTATGQPTLVRASNGVVTRLVHDALGRTTSRTVTGPDGEPLLELEDGWSERHERASRRRDGVETRFEYDAAGRLASATRPGRAARWSYEADGHRTTTIVDGVTTTCTLDARGCPVALSDRTRLTWDAGGRLVRREHTGGVDRRAQRAATVDRWTWSSRDELVKVERAGRPAVTFTYDATGLPRTRTTGGVTTTFVHDAQDRLLAEVGPGGAARVWTWGTFGLAPLAFTTGGVTTTLHADDLGHVLAYTDAKGALAGRAAFDPWGEVELDPGATLPLVLAGCLVDREAGLVRFGARWYDPALGQFLSPDPLDLEGGVNPWLYAEASPLDLVDPSGWYSVPGWRVQQERAARRLQVRRAYVIEDAGGRPVPDREWVLGRDGGMIDRVRRGDQVTITGDRRLSPGGAPVVVKLAGPPPSPSALLRAEAARDRKGPRYQSVPDQLVAAGEAFADHFHGAQEKAFANPNGELARAMNLLESLLPGVDQDQDAAARRFARTFVESLPPVVLARASAAAFAAEARMTAARAQLRRKDLTPEQRGALLHELDAARQTFESELGQLALGVADTAGLAAGFSQVLSGLRVARQAEAAAELGARQAARAASTVANDLAESEGLALARANRTAAREASAPATGLAQVVDPDAELRAARRSAAGESAPGTTAPAPVRTTATEDVTKRPAGVEQSAASTAETGPAQPRAPPSDAPAPKAPSATVDPKRSIEHPSAAIGKASDEEIAHLRKTRGWGKDVKVSEINAARLYEAQDGVRDVIVGEEKAMRGLGAPVKSGEKRVDLALTLDDGLQVPVEVKNQTVPAIISGDNRAVAKFELVAKRADMNKISHFEVAVHTDSVLEPGVRVDAMGWLETEAADLDGNGVWGPLVIGGKRVRVVRGPLGRISVD